MGIKLKFPLKELLGGAVTGEYSDGQLRALYSLAHTISLQLLRRKAAAGKIKTDLLSMSLPDMACDSVAELFRRGDHNDLVEFRRYVESKEIPIDNLSNEALMVHMYKLVYTAVNDNIFKMYNEADPVLGKIIRNLKYAAEHSTEFKLIEQFDTQFLLLSPYDPLLHRRTMSDEFLEQEVFSIMSENHETEKILARLAEVLRSQDVYQRKIRLLALAVTMKNGYERFRSQEIAEAATMDSFSEQHDYRTIIHEACSAISREMKSRYVDKGKVDQQTFFYYMKAVERTLLSEFSQDHEQRLSYFDALQHELPLMKKEEYADRHRTMFEYLAKLTKERARKMLKNL